MSHEYSVQIHKWIAGKLEEIKIQKLTAEENNDKFTKEYLTGKLDELLFFRQYLAGRIDLKTQDYFK